MTPLLLPSIDHIPDCILKEVIVFLSEIHYGSILSLRLVNKKWLVLCNDIKITYHPTSHYTAKYPLLEYVKRCKKGDPKKRALQVW